MALREEAHKKEIEELKMKLIEPPKKTFFVIKRELLSATTAQTTIPLLDNT